MRGAEAQLALRQNPFTTEDVAAAQAAVQQAQAALDVARTQRDDAFVTAPADGVISARPATVGALGPRRPIATLVSDAVEITAPVEEAQFPRIQPGQAVVITTPPTRGAVLRQRAQHHPLADTRSRAFTARIRPEDPWGASGPACSSRYPSPLRSGRRCR